MNYIIALFIVSALFIAFITWRLLSVRIGMRKRDEKLLEALNPIAERLSEGRSVEQAEIAALAKKPEYRPLLHKMLTNFDRIGLFPTEYLSFSAQGEGLLAYWMMHPNELQAAPSEMELVEALDREQNGEPVKFHVYRYRMPAGHWAEKDGWLLGLAGPFIESDVPYSGMPGAFSRCGDKEGEIQPAALVDWYIGITKPKVG